MSEPEKSGQKLISKNPTAFQDYLIDQVVEAGLVLTGTEIKSLRAQAPNLRDAYVEVRRTRAAGPLEAWLVNAHIAPYQHGNIWNHEPLRKRKLLLQGRQIEELFGALTKKGYTVVPTRMYFSKGYAKIEIGLGKLKKKHDKRESDRARSAQREMDVARKRAR